LKAAFLSAFSPHLAVSESGVSISILTSFSTGKNPLYGSNMFENEKSSIHRPMIRSGIFRVRISMALYSLQDS